MAGEVASARPAVSKLGEYAKTFELEGARSNVQNFAGVLERGLAQWRGSEAVRDLPYRDELVTGCLFILPSVMGGEYTCAVNFTPADYERFADLVVCYMRGICPGYNEAMSESHHRLVMQFCHQLVSELLQLGRY